MRLPSTPLTYQNRRKSRWLRLLVVITVCEHQVSVIQLKQGMTDVHGVIGDGQNENPSAELVDTLA
uniref:Uncharacterized protein n=1 Tax=mine drainage metagenome TaxID=410659 RepID=E6QB17_9ZZZZ